MGKTLELICVNCSRKVCHSCALFGEHKGHDVREAGEAINEIQIRIDVLMEMY